MNDSGERATPPTDSSRAERVAEVLWLQAERSADPQGDVMVIIDRLFTGVDAGLRRWVGAEGFAALLARAAAETLPKAPALGAISDIVKSPSETSARHFTSEQTKAAVVALLVTMMRNLGNIVGEDMAIRLVELSGNPSSRAIASTETNDIPS